MWAEVLKGSHNNTRKAPGQFSLVSIVIVVIVARVVILLIDLSSCDLTMENAFAPVHNPLFLPQNARTWLPRVVAGGGPLGRNHLQLKGWMGLPTVPPSFCFGESGNKVRGVQVPSQLLLRADEPFLEIVPDDELLVWCREMHQKIVHLLCPLFDSWMYWHWLLLLLHVGQEWAQEGSISGDQSLGWMGGKAF